MMRMFAPQGTPRAPRIVMSKVFLVLVGLLGIALSGACGGNEESSTPPPVSPWPPATVVAPGVFEYPAKGYSLHYPADWSADDNFLTTAQMTVDAFFAPTSEAGVTPNISIIKEVLAAEITPDQFMSEKLKVLSTVLGHEPDIIRDIEVSQTQALRVEYTSTLGEIAQDIVEVYLARGGSGWTIKYVAPGGKKAEFLSALDEVLTSLEIQE